MFRYCEVRFRPNAKGMSQHSLFATAGAPFADGYAYEEDFLSVDDEAALLDALRALPFSNAQYLQFEARRRIVSYGGRYDFSARQLSPAQPIPEFLHPLRARAAQWAGLAPERLTHALVAEYTAGTPLGWHRDVPEFECVIGISLLSACRMRFRRYPPPGPREPGSRQKSLAIELTPRSIYRLSGDARWGWQHSVPPVRALRYSITFRTLRSRRLPPPPHGD